MSEEQTESQDKNRPISMTEAAELYGFNADYLRQLAQRERLKAYKSGNTWLTTPANVEEYIRSRQKKGVYRDDIEAD
ncbi:MAG: helix-turn-helix domain-containing protein [Anaerolineales bacterium]|nr:helix-turn-helix domain-containing protein [Anaerolineales bacterium]